MNDFPLKNWIPYKLVTSDGQIQCRWLNTYGEPFVEPFFDETIVKIRGLRGRHAAISSVSDTIMVREWAADIEAVEPAAFIFHISRCGSTLVSQLLATSDQHISLSEVPFFDDILRLPYKGSDFSQKAVDELLIAAIKFYGQKRNRQEHHLFIKTDSWHMFFYKRLRQLYPLVPFILLYRSPDEVFTSQRQTAGMHAVPGLIEPEVFGFKPGDIDYERHDVYVANVLERYLLQYLKIIETDNRFLLLNYNEGPMPIIRKMASFINISFSPQALLNMAERSLYDAKKPGERFSEEAPTNIPACLDKAMELYRALEEKRKALYPAENGTP
jgi:Sulfotransferase domain